MAPYLADTSAWHRSGYNPAIANRWQELLDADELALCVPVELELLYSARGPADYAQLHGDLRRLPAYPLDARVADAASRTQALLAARSRHRGPNTVDLLVAAVAEVNGATLLHYDRHFDAIARATGQRAEWLARPGSIP